MQREATEQRRTDRYREMRAGITRAVIFTRIRGGPRADPRSRLAFLIHRVPFFRDRPAERISSGRKRNCRRKRRGRSTGEENPVETASPRSAFDYYRLLYPRAILISVPIRSRSILPVFRRNLREHRHVGANKACFCFPAARFDFVARSRMFGQA